jgi:hypothetical protein
MNVAKYIKRERAPSPTIHENHYMEEFTHPHQFSTAGKQRLAIAEEVEGARPFPINKGEKIPLDNFAYDAHERVRAGEHPWDVYGAFGAPLSNLPIENKLLYNPHNLDDKEVFVARFQEQAGTNNDFTERLQNIETKVPLNEVRNANTDFEASLNKVKESLRDLDAKNEPKRFVRKVKTDALQPEPAFKQRRRIVQPAKVVVEPVRPPREPVEPPETTVLFPATNAKVARIKAAVKAAAEAPAKRAEEKRLKEFTEKVVKNRAARKITKAVKAHAEENAERAATEAASALTDIETLQTSPSVSKEVAAALKRISDKLYKPDLSSEDIAELKKQFRKEGIPFSNAVKTARGMKNAFETHIKTMERAGLKYGASDF